MSVIICSILPCKNLCYPFVKLCQSQSKTFSVKKTSVIYLIEDYLFSEILYPKIL